MKRFIVAAVAGFVVGLPCVAGATDDAAHGYVLPAASGLPAEQLARVVATTGPRNAASKFVALFDAQRKEIKVRKWPVISVTGTMLTLTPGRYQFTVSCREGVGDSRYLPMSMTVSSGRTYSVWCEPIPWSAPVLRFKDESHAEWEAVRSGVPVGARAPARTGAPTNVNALLLAASDLAIHQGGP